MSDSMMQSGLRVAVDARAALDRSSWTGAQRSAGVLELLETRERIDAMLLQETGEWDRAKTWALDDTLSAVSWLCHRAPLTRARTPWCWSAPRGTSPNTRRPRRRWMPGTSPRPMP